jgi:hypothetical protein
MIFYVSPAFMLIAIACMWFVTRGEAHLEQGAV